jgi:low affinity Fe/Cu permease
LFWYHLGAGSLGGALGEQRSLCHIALPPSFNKRISSNPRKLADRPYVSNISAEWQLVRTASHHDLANFWPADTFLLAVAVVLVWAITGPLFGFSDTWQLVINTGTTIVTFLMVFLIQATQNRDTLALQLKLDELILATRNARNRIAGIEEASDEEIEKAKVEVLDRAG